ncbi:uncharacterized protein LOC118598423, partial [Oryzias melastigma]|uniref:uncharacterized protein LOC118598423 n=1 Tax=Oryzias melastigma TaxID=30732 RepID=UPI00168D14DF
MPKKGKRSQAAKTRWQKFDDFLESPCDGSKEIKEKSSKVCNGEKENPSCESKIAYADAVKNKQQLDAPCEAGPTRAGKMKTRVRKEKPTPSVMSYAEVVKRGKNSDELCAAKPLHAQHVNEPPQPSVRQLCASWSQASGRYGKYKNMQCTCNSLTFLAFLCEDENITTADLDLVLDKGNSMYTDARKRFPADNHLATDQLPETVPARRCVYDADMSVLSRYGTFGDPPPGSVDEFLRFDAGIACLQTEIQYALLIMLDLCIAVFRTSSGRFGFFDPHSRSPDGLPTPPDMFDRESGTAVMLTFTTLYEMIDWLSLCYSMNGAQPSSVYELKPVKFLCSIPIVHESVSVPES